MHPGEIHIFQEHVQATHSRCTHLNGCLTGGQGDWGVRRKEKGKNPVKGKKITVTLIPWFQGLGAGAGACRGLWGAGGKQAGVVSRWQGEEGRALRTGC